MLYFQLCKKLSLKFHSLFSFITLYVSKLPPLPYIKNCTILSNFFLLFYPDKIFQKPKTQRSITPKIRHFCFFLIPRPESRPIWAIFPHPFRSIFPSLKVCAFGGKEIQWKNCSVFRKHLRLLENRISGCL